MRIEGRLRTIGSGLSGDYDLDVAKITLEVEEQRIYSMGQLGSLSLVSTEHQNALLKTFLEKLPEIKFKVE